MEPSYKLIGTINEFIKIFIGYTPTNIKIGSMKREEEDSSPVPEPSSFTFSFNKSALKSKSFTDLLNYWDEFESNSLLEHTYSEYANKKLFFTSISFYPIS